MMNRENEREIFNKKIKESRVTFNMNIEKSSEYKNLISGIKNQIKTSRQKALLAVNKELLILYWNIGRTILEYQEK